MIVFAAQRNDHRSVARRPLRRLWHRTGPGVFRHLKRIRAARGIINPLSTTSGPPRTFRLFTIGLKLSCDGEKPCHTARGAIWTRTSATFVPRYGKAKIILSGSPG